MGETRSCFPLAPFTGRGRSVPCYTLESASEKLMSASAPSPRPFGPYVLTHALGTDALGEAWRAGTAGAPRLKPFLLVRTFTAAAIDPSALLSAMQTAVNLVDDVQGPTIARGTVMGAIDDIPFLGTLYVEGRTLDHLLAARLLGSPLPVEHGLLIAERLLTALEAGAPVERFTGAAHGFLVPPFVCISNEGEARVFGHGLGAGLLPALKNARTRQTFAPYVAPEVLAEGKPSTPGDLYSVGAILYEALTGRAPPPGVALESVEGANLAVDGTPVPEDIRRLLRRALHPDPRMRDRQISSFRRDLSALLYGGPYAPSTFNLAFFLQKQFDKAIQREKLELAAEEEIDPKTLAVPLVPTSAPAGEPLRRRAVEGSGSRPLAASTPPPRPPPPPPPPRPPGLRSARRARGPFRYGPSQDPRPRNRSAGRRCGPSPAEPSCSLRPAPSSRSDPRLRRPFRCRRPRRRPPSRRPRRSRRRLPSSSGRKIRCSWPLSKRSSRTSSRSADPKS